MGYKKRQKIRKPNYNEPQHIGDTNRPMHKQQLTLEKPIHVFNEYN